LYEFLHAKRAVWLERSSDTRREAVESAKAQHAASSRFQNNLLSLSSLSRAAPAKKKLDILDSCLDFLARRNITAVKCRLMCLSDATGSMSRVWNNTKASVRVMLERIAAISGGSGNIAVKW
jgi:hypothetical protein